MMSGPDSMNPNRLDYQVWGKCWSLNTHSFISPNWQPNTENTENKTKAGTEAKTSSRVLK